MMKKPEYKDMNVPSLHEDIKTMNGKSSKRLAQCLDNLSELLDESDKHAKAPDDDTDLRSTGT